VGADDNCYERADLINNSARPCKALYGPCVTSAEQYFKRGLLGVHRSPLVNITEQVGVVHKYFCPQLVVFAWPNLVAFLLLQSQKVQQYLSTKSVFFHQPKKRVHFVDVLFIIFSAMECWPKVIGIVLLKMFLKSLLAHLWWLNMELDLTGL